MESDISIMAKNPWDISNLDELLFFCCPECDYKDKSRTVFYEHAVANHSEAGIYLVKIEAKSDDDLENNTGESRIEDVKIEADLDNMISEDFSFPPDDADGNWCVFCGGQFSTQSRLLTHKKMVHGICEDQSLNGDKGSWMANFIAPEPDSMPESDTRRTRSSVNKRKRKDQDSNEAPTREEKYKYHVVSTKCDQYQCYTCGYKEKSLEGVKLHQDKVHGMDNELLFGPPNDHCPVCHDKLDYAGGRVHICSATIQKPNKISVLALSTDDMQDIMCYKCGEIRKSVPAIREHQKTVHGSAGYQKYGPPRSFQCLKCKNMFEREAELSLHMCKYYGDARVGNRYVCSQCGEVYNTQSAYDAHMSTVHNDERRFHCNKCEYKAKTHALLRQHMNKMHGNLMVQVCELCGKSFKYAASLQSHLSTYHGNKREFVCDKCGATYGSKDGLRNHSNRIHPTYFMCTLCDKLVNSAKKIRQHMFTSHQCQNTNEIYVCPSCNTQCPTIAKLDEHNMYVHSLERTVSCSQCKFTCTTQLTLKLHLLAEHVSNATEQEQTKILMEVFGVPIRAAYRPKVAPKKGCTCDVCGKVLNRPGALADHKRQVHQKDTHTLKCDQCSYTTFTPCLMRNHMKGHDKSKRYECDKCPSHFFNMRDLKTHIKQVHEGFRRFQCPHCERAYNDSTQFRHHMMSFHNSLDSVTA